MPLICFRANILNDINFFNFIIDLYSLTIYNHFRGFGAYSKGVSSEFSGGLLQMHIMFSFGIAGVKDKVIFGGGVPSGGEGGRTQIGGPFREDFIYV